MKTDLLSWPSMFAVTCWTISGSLLTFVFMEYVVLRLLCLSRLGAIVRVTYYEALLQPFSIVVILGSVIIMVFFGMMPFFTNGEDPKMFRDIATSFLLLFPLVLMVFASGKVVDEEIENRTMLTLMSKPIARWQVVVGKYLGVLCLVFVAITVLGMVTCATAYVRYFDDQRIDIQVAGRTVYFLYAENHKAVIGMVAIVALTFLQLATLAAISVAVSTRFGLVLNMTLIAILYVGANMTRFVPDLGLPSPWQSITQYFAYLLPYLSNFDLSQRLVYGSYRWDINDPIGGPTSGIPLFSQIWGYVGLATVYAVFYSGAALSIGTAMFRTRELS